MTTIANRLIVWLGLSLLVAAQPRAAAADDAAFEQDGHRYIGEMRGGNFHGSGSATLGNGTRLDGTWQDNRFMAGKVRRADGIEYGFTGRLTLIFRRLADQGIIGSGTASLPDGRRYSGTIDKRGHFHGEGIMVLADGSRRYGLWDKSRFARAKSDHWQATSFAAEGLDPARLHELRGRLLDGTYKSINSVIVVKRGKILIEDYFNGTDRFTPHDVQSVGKSFASALIGIAVERRYIAGVDEKLVTFLPALERGASWDSRKDDITLRHLLTMSYGLADDRSDGHYADYANYDADWVAGVMGHAIKFPPGQRFAYSSAASRLIAPVIAEASGMPAIEFIEKFLFAPLGIDLYAFRMLPDGNPSLAGLEGITARDLAKFGQLYLNKGTWQGRRILSERWVRDSTASHLKVAPNSPLTYGYNFWIAESWWDGHGDVRTYFASGLGGNKIFVIPSRNLVVVITSDAYGEDYAHKQVHRMMERHLLPAVTQKKALRPE